MEGVMSFQSRQEYIRTQRGRYRDGTREQKRRILDEGCSLFGVHRNLERLDREPSGMEQKRPSDRHPPQADCATSKSAWRSTSKPSTRTTAGSFSTIRCGGTSTTAPGPWRSVAVAPTTRGTRPTSSRNNGATICARTEGQNSTLTRMVVQRSSYLSPSL